MKKIMRKIKNNNLLLSLWIVVILSSLTPLVIIFIQNCQASISEKRDSYCDCVVAYTAIISAITAFIVFFYDKQKAKKERAIDIAKIFCDEIIYDWTKVFSVFLNKTSILDKINIEEAIKFDSNEMFGLRLS